MSNTPQNFKSPPTILPPFVFFFDRSTAARTGFSELNLPDNVGLSLLPSTSGLWPGIGESLYCCALNRSSVAACPSGEIEGLPVGFS